MSSELVALPPSPPGVEWSLRGLVVTDPSLPYEQLEAILRGAAELKRAMSFVIGDALIFMEARYGERYSQAMNVTGLAYSTLSNYVYVCDRVRTSRRRDKLGFGHHEAVAPLEPADQVRWLDKAEEDGWTRDQLRDAVQDARALAGETPPPRRQRQEVLDPPGAVEATRNLSTARETLVKLGTGLEPATAEAAGISGAIRAIDDAGATVRKAAEKLDRPALVDAARNVIRNATASGGFYMVETNVFQEFAALVAAEE